jgi:hypothetical protein
MKQNTKINTKNTKLRKKSKKTRKLNKKNKNTKNKNIIRKIGGNGGDEPPTTTRKRERKDNDNDNDDENDEINDNNKKAKTDNPIYKFFYDNTNRDEKFGILSAGDLPIRGLTPRQKLVKPTEFHEEEYGIFLNFLRMYIKQPFIREYLVKKYNPDIPYAMLRIDFKDSYYKKKLELIRSLLNDRDYQKYDFILDIAEGFESGGHYSALKRKNSEIVYMDSDPFYYANGPHKAFSELLINFNNPVEIYGNNNKNDEMESIKSIQNINKFDYNCQSWSLLYLTIPRFMDLPGHIKYNEGDVILHEPEYEYKHIETFPLYINNFKILISFWITILKDNGIQLNRLIKYTQFANWTSDDIIEELHRIDNYIDELMNDPNIEPKEKYNIYEENLNKGTTDFTFFTQK